MERANAAFLVVVALSTLLGASAAAEYGSELRTAETASRVSDRISTEAVDASIGDGSLSVTVRIRNPTGTPVVLTGSYFRVVDAAGDQLAAGAGQRVDDGDATLPAEGALVVEYRVRLSEEAEDELRERAGTERLSLTGTHGFRLDGQSFTVAIEPTPLALQGEEP